MSEYISREAFRREINEHRPGRSYEDAWALTILDFIPAADVRPVVKARIVDMRYAEDDGEWKCTHCGWQYTLCVCGKDVTSKINFCPNCGAKMEEN